MEISNMPHRNTLYRVSGKVQLTAFTNLLLQVLVCECPQLINASIMTELISVVHTVSLSFYHSREQIINYV